MAGTVSPSHVVGSRRVAPCEWRDEAMSSTKLLAAAGAVVILAMPAARAADLPPLPPPMYQRPIIQEFSGRYLRGDIGFSNQKVDTIFHVPQTAPGITSQRNALDLHPAPCFGR